MQIPVEVTTLQNTIFRRFPQILLPEMVRFVGRYLQHLPIKVPLSIYNNHWRVLII